MTAQVAANDAPVVSFANHILGDWNSAMDGFFSRIERKMTDRDLTPQQVRAALARGYGDDIADAWVEWLGEA